MFISTRRFQWTTARCGWGLRVLLGGAVYGVLLCHIALTLADDLPSPTYVAVTNRTRKQLELYWWDDTSKTLQPTNRPLAVAVTQEEPCSATFTHDNRFIIVEHCAPPENILIYELMNGALNLRGEVSGGLLNGNLVLSVNGDSALTTSFAAAPDTLGRGNENNVLLSYSVGGDGTMELLAAEPTQGQGAAGVAVTYDGMGLIVAHRFSSDLTVFNIVDPSNPRFVQRIPLPGGPIKVAVDPHNRFFAALTRDEDPSLWVFTLDDSGNLRSARAATDIGPRDLRIDAEGTNVYVLDDVRGKVLRYEIIDSQVPVLRESQGTRSSASRAIALSDSQALVLVGNGFDPDGAGERVQGFGIGPEGTLTPFEPPTLIAGVPTAIAITAPPTPQAASSPTSSPAASAPSADTPPPASPATSSPTVAAQAGGGGCSMVPTREGAAVPWLVAFGNIGLPCLVLAWMQTIRWRRGKR